MIKRSLQSPENSPDPDLLSPVLNAESQMESYFLKLTSVGWKNMKFSYILQQTLISCTYLFAWAMEIGKFKSLHEKNASSTTFK